MRGTSSARIGALRVRWRRPRANGTPLTGLQVVAAITYGLFVAFLSVAVLELIGFQWIVCGMTDGCEALQDAHAAYLGIVVAPTAVLCGFLVARWNAGRMRLANADADWVKRQAGTK